MEESRISPFSNCGLSWCLQQLDKEEFQTFKELLVGSVSGLVPGSFPWVEVPGADPQQLAFLLHEHCQALVVWSVAMDIFLEMNLPVLSQKAKEEMEKCSLAEILQDLMATKTDQGSSTGQPAGMSHDIKQDDTAAVKTKDQDSGPGGTAAEDYKRHVLKRAAAEPGAPRAVRAFAADGPQLRALSAVFEPDAQGFRPRTVVLQGGPGAGKSALARSVLLHWARGELYPGAFSYVFLLDFRALPWRSARASFGSLLAAAWPEAEVPVAEVLARPERLLFLVDGCDDLVVASEDADLGACDSWTERRPVPHLVRSLLRKALLPACSLMAVVRDRGLDRLRPMLVSPRYLLVAGLGLEERTRALLGRVRGEARRGQVLRAVLDNHVLTDGCQAAVTWWLLGRALELQLAARSLPPARPQSLTGLYVTFVLHQLAPPEGPGRCLGPDEQAVLQGLCRLAARGLWAQKLAFGGGDLGPLGLTGPALSGLLGRGVLLRWERHGGQRFTFPHPSLQAFFAALHYALEGPEAGREAQAPGPESPESPSDLRQLSSDAHLLQARRFLFGLMNPEAVRALEDLLGRAVVPAVRRVLLRWVSLLGQQAAASPLDFLDSFYCLFETQDEEFVRQALSGFRDVGLTVTRPMDLSVAAFCLRHCRHLRGVRVDVREVFPEEESAETWPIIPQGLQTKPLLIEWWENLCFVLGTHPSLQQLDLAGSILSEWAVRTLCVQLRQPACRIQKLLFKGTQMTLGLQHLWKMLVVNRNIRHLNLDNVHLREEDVGAMQEALCHPHCLLESLRLDHCGLTDACCPLLSQVLLASRSLRSLSLTGNQVTDQGVAALGEALKAPQCALRRLILGSCGLPADACQHLSEVLAASQSLTHLDLSSNPLAKEGVTPLCRSLKSLACILQRLMLRDCGLDAAACGLLSLGLVANRHLTHLSLSLNPLGDDGLDLLSEVLLESPFRLLDLELVRCGLTALGCRKLSQVLATNTQLQSLDLAANALGDDGVAALCPSLRLRTASLRRLGLEACELTSGCCEALASALLCNRSLRSLNLLRNRLCPRGVRVLCGAFTRPACKLQVVGLWKWQFPEATIQLLEEAEFRRPLLVIDDRWYSSDREDEGDRYWWRN